MKKLYISPGNMKVKFPIFNLPAQETCPGSTVTCRQDCYAMKAQRQYPGARSSRKANLKLSREAGFVTSINAWFSRRRKPVRYFRIHESGDFYDQGYLDRWIEIAKAQPKTKFLAYTKSFHLDFSKRPQNFVVYWSVMPDTDTSKLPDGPVAYACFDGVDDNPYSVVAHHVFQCKGQKCHECMHCFKAKTGHDVHFQKH